jgi:hypothetical protein
MCPSSDCVSPDGGGGWTFSAGAVAACCIAFASIANFDNMSFKLPDALALWPSSIPELLSTPTAGRAAEMTGV